MHAFWILVPELRLNICFQRQSAQQEPLQNETTASDHLNDSQPFLYESCNEGLDAFTEWRRLDYPILTAGPATVLDGKIPLRFFYPGREQSFNGDNYKAAVAG
jgi:hypothetical protein